MEIVHQPHLWHVLRSILVKEKVGVLKDLIVKVNYIFYNMNSFGKSAKFKKYLHGVCYAGSRLLFKFRSGTHGLNEELGILSIERGKVLSVRM